MSDWEESGLLMFVIRTLHETDTGQEREEQNRNWSSSSSSIRLVAHHQGDLSSVMQTCSTLSGRLHRARGKLSAVCKSPFACKELFKSFALLKRWAKEALAGWGRTETYTSIIEAKGFAWKKSESNGKERISWSNRRTDQQFESFKRKIEVCWSLGRS